MRYPPHGRHRQSPSTTRTTAAALALVALIAVLGALLLFAFTVPVPVSGFTVPASGHGAAGSDDGRNGGRAVPPPWPAEPRGRDRRPITVAPVSALPVAGDGHEPARTGPPMSSDMLLGAALVAVGSGVALAVLYRSRPD
ncbi:hypothetical protein ACIHFE_00245 [Streptomyces sp. NPDC052396]|uniref:hypothetical protein n=1 Tax=Streptomyces sp. NPDC052396 TaxID=3365689 RepID=UPI0037CF0CA5